jgi:hypothetical protein
MSDNVTAREIEVYALNFSSSHYNGAGSTLSKHYQSGGYSKDRAIKYLERYLITPAAKQYRLEHGSMTDSWYKLFPKQDRLAAAESIADQFLGEFKLGNFWE